MDEYSSSGMDPEVKRYFRKILNSFAVGLLWLMSMGIAGLFFKLAIVKNNVRWYNIVFYGVFLSTLALLILFFYRVWRKKDKP